MIFLFQKYHPFLTLVVSLPLALLIFFGAGSMVFDVSRKWTTISIQKHLS